MLILLPPSETKRDGGTLPPLELESLRFPELTRLRRRVVDVVSSLAADPAGTVRALRLGPRQLAEVDRNRRLATSGTMAALERYTGVVYDTLGFGTVSERAREFAHRHVVVHSALLGPVAALDPIPAYRLSFDSRVPGLSLRRLWAVEVAPLLARERGLILDLRSEGYAGLGPAPSRAESMYVRVVTRNGDGTTRALNHVNKRAKGAFVRSILESGVDHPDVASLCAWAAGHGFEMLRRGAELELVVDAGASRVGDIAHG